MTDRLLLEQFVDSRNQAAFAELVNRHAGMVHATARRMSGSDADDVSQAVFLLLSKKASGLLRHQNLAGWLYETTRNCAANAGRQQRRQTAKIHAAREALMPGSTSSPDQTELLELLDAGLSHLSGGIRRVLLLRYLENLSVEQTAEQLSLTRAAVMKRATRGLSQLREFFHRRGKTVALESVTGCMVSQAVQLSAEQHARLASAATGNAAAAAIELASSSAKILTVKTVGVAAVVILAASAIGIELVVGHIPLPAVAATLQGTQPAMTGDPQAAADQFLQSLADANVEAVTRFISLADDSKSRALARDYIDHFRNEIYSRFPQRLKIDGSRIMKDANGKFLGGTFDVMSPTDAEIGHLVFSIGSGRGNWVVTSATYTDAEARIAQPQGVDSFNYTRALKSLGAFLQLHPANNIDTTTLADIDTFKKHFGDFVLAMKGSDLAPSGADVDTVDGELTRVHEIFLHSGMAGLKQESARCETDSKLMAAISRLMATAGPMQARIDQQQDAHHTELRPVSVERDLLIADGENDLILPGPLTFPEWLRSSAAYKQWQSVHDIRTFVTRDDENNTYTVAAQGWSKDTDGSTHEIISQMHMYRADGTLAEITNWNFNGDLLDWRTVDATGKHLVWKMEQHRRDNGRQSVSRATRFDSEGNEQLLGISQDGRVEPHAAWKNPIGE